MDTSALAEEATSILPQTRVANSAVRIGWWVALLAVVIALILIIISMTYFTKGNSSTGTGYLIAGSVIGILGGWGMWYTNEGLGGILVSRAKNGTAGKFLKKIGLGEYDFDGETVKDMNEPDCGCSVDGGREYEEFDEDINEMDYVESSDDEEENPFEDEEEEREGKRKEEREEKREEKKKKEKKDNIDQEEIKTTKKKSKKVSFKKGGDENILDMLKSIAKMLKADELEEKLAKEEEVKIALDYLKDNVRQLNEAYRKLNSDDKGAVDDLLQFLRTDSDELNGELEEFKNELTA